MNEPTNRIFLTRQQIINLADTLDWEGSDELTGLDNDYIFEIQQYDEPGLKTKTKCIGSHCDNVNLELDHENYWIEKNE